MVNAKKEGVVAQGEWGIRGRDALNFSPEHARLFFRYHMGIREAKGNLTKICFCKK